MGLRCLSLWGSIYVYFELNFLSLFFFTRRLFITSCLDAIASYKVELEATAGRPQAVQAYLASFTDLQIRLDRMLILKWWGISSMHVQHQKEDASWEWNGLEFIDRQTYANRS